MAKGKKSGMQWYDWVLYLLLVVGGLVHLVQAFGYYPLDTWFSSMMIVAKLLKGAVGIAAIVAIIRIPMILTGGKSYGKKR